MRKLIIALTIFIGMATLAPAHQIQDDAASSANSATGGSSGGSGAQSAVEEEESDDSKGPLERAGAELDKALNKTLEVLTNSALEFRVKNHLHNHNEKLWRELIVTAKDGEVTVEGEVEDEQTANRVLDIVKSTTGVLRVVNKLKIKTYGGPSTT